MKEDTLKTVGVWAFLGGVVLALIVGLVTGFMQLEPGVMGLISGFMVVLGLVVGALNVTDKEVNSFIIAAIGMAVGSSALAGMGAILSASALTAVAGKMIQTAFTVFGTFVAGAVFVPAIKSVYRLSKD
jgi:hypothetical protein